MNKILRLFLAIFVLCAARQISGFAQGEIKITQPEDNAVFYPGQTITVNVAALEGFTLTEGKLAISDFFEADITGLPEEFTTVIPEDKIGKIMIAAAAENPDSELSADMINATVRSGVPPQSLELDQDELTIFTDWDDNIVQTPYHINTLYAHYPNDVIFDISGADYGTTYISSDAEVISVDSEGICQPHKVGEAAITVANSGLSKTIPVVFVPPLGRRPLETIPPVTEVTIEPAANGAGWHNTDITIGLTADDNPDGSGVAEIDYSILGSDTQNIYVESDTTGFGFYQEGIYELIYFARDRESNTEVARSHPIKIDKTPPQLTLTVSSDTLWPPNHKMVEINVTAEASDNLDPDPQVTLESITSSEPDNARGPGDGHTNGDIEITPDGKILLRAERNCLGHGRVYTLTYSARDAAGNETTAQTTIEVPRSLCLRRLLEALKNRNLNH